MPRPLKKVTGVYERVKNSNVWYARYKQDGKQVRISFGSREAAIDHLDKIRRMKKEGTGKVPLSAKVPALTYEELKQVAAGVTINQLAEGLIKKIEGPQSTYRDKIGPVSRIRRVCETFGSRPASSIKPSELSDWCEALGGAPSTRNKFRSTISALYTYGKERDMVSVNPARDFKANKVSNGKLRWLDKEEEARLRNILQADVDREVAAGNLGLANRKLHHIYELDIALGTGMRRGEQYSLTWDDVSFTRRNITLNQTKNGEPRVVEMIDDVIAAMKGLKAIPMVRKSRSADRPNQAPENSVFSLGWNNGWFDKACQRAKLKDVTWHTLRHTFCSRLAQSGASILIIQKAAGHKSIAMSARYSHLDTGTLRSALSVLNRKPE